jgi:tRNA nucleotidyltransferase (CCA-adding enzyme)
MSWYDNWEGPEEDIPSVFYTQDPNVGDLLSWTDDVDTQYYLVHDVTPEKVVLRHASETGTPFNDGVLIEVDRENWAQWAHQYRIILEDSFPEVEPTGELWPDFLPWGEAEQDYYRTAALEDMLRPGDQVRYKGNISVPGESREANDIWTYLGPTINDTVMFRNDSTGGNRFVMPRKAVETLFRAGLMWVEMPDTLPWSDEEQQYYRTAAVTIQPVDGETDLVLTGLTGLEETVEDPEEAAELYEREEPVWVSLPGWARDEPFFAWNAYDDQRLVGSIVAAIDPNGHDYYVSWLYINPSYRRQDVFMNLIAPLWQRAQAEGRDIKGSIVNDRLKNVYERWQNRQAAPFVHEEDAKFGMGLVRNKQYAMIWTEDQPAKTVTWKGIRHAFGKPLLSSFWVDNDYRQKWDVNYDHFVWMMENNMIVPIEREQTLNFLPWSEEEQDYYRSAGLSDWLKTRQYMKDVQPFERPGWIWTVTGYYCETCGEGPWQAQAAAELHVERHKPPKDPFDEFFDSLDRESKLTKWVRRATIKKMSYPVLHTVLAADPSAQAAADALQAAGGQVYIVGGAVRDAVLGQNPKDVDLMVGGLTEQQITEALSPLGKLNFTGAQFGVFRFRLGDNPEVEIALPRTERSTGAGYTDFEVTTDPFLPIEEDLYRRDFTGNAMAYSPFSQELIDPHGGAEDLANSQLRLVNPDAFRDDPLRVVRALVANARFGLEPDPELQAALEANAHRIKNLPGERIQMELDKLLSGSNPAGAIQLAEQSGILDYMIPELSSTVGFDQMNPHHDLNVFDHTMAALRAMSDISNDPDLRLAALFHDAGKPASFWRDEEAPEGGGGHFYKKMLDDGTQLGDDHEVVGADLADAFMRRLRYPNNRRERVVSLIRNHMFPYFDTMRGARKFLNALGGDTNLAFDLLKLREADASGKRTGQMNDFDTQELARARELVQAALEENSAVTVKDLAVNGHDLMQLGLEREEIGNTLRDLLERVVENPELNERETLLGLIQPKE